MKRFVIAGLVSIASFSALAAERQISDLMYLPNQGTKFGETGLGILAGNAKTDEGRSFYMGYGVNQDLGYALSDNLSLTLGLSMAHVDVKTRSGGNNTFTTQAGINEPTLAARYRALESDLIMDVVGTLQAKIGDQEIDGSRTNGLDGKNAAAVELNLGQKKGNWQYVGVVGLEYNMEGTTKDKANDVKATFKPHLDYKVGAAGQYQMNETTFVRAGVNVDLDSKVKAKKNADDLVASNTFNYSLGLSYRASKDLLLSGSYNLRDVKSKDVRNSALSIVGVSALYQF